MAPVRKKGHARHSSAVQDRRVQWNAHTGAAAWTSSPKRPLGHRRVLAPPITD